MLVNAGGGGGEDAGEERVVVVDGEGEGEKGSPPTAPRGVLASTPLVVVMVVMVVMVVVVVVVSLLMVVAAVGDDRAVPPTPAELRLGVRRQRLPLPSSPERRVEGGEGRMGENDEPATGSGGGGKHSGGSTAIMQSSSPVAPGVDSVSARLGFDTFFFLICLFFSFFLSPLPVPTPPSLTGPFPSTSPQREKLLEEEKLP